MTNLDEITSADIYEISANTEVYIILDTIYKNVSNKESNPKDMLYYNYDYLLSEKAISILKQKGFKVVKMENRQTSKISYNIYWTNIAN